MKHSVKNRVLSGTGLVLATFLFVAIIILANTTLTTWRIDLTENKLFTLSNGTINILKNLEEPVQLDFYFSQKAMIDFPLLASYGVRVRDMLTEYTTHANGKLLLNIIEPETFSETEDQAVASGLRAVSANATGDRAYFGLVGTNSTDDEKVIPFFQTNREPALEYDITKLIYNLAYPDKRVVGIISQLPMMSNHQKQDSTKTWTIINALSEFFEVKNLGDKSNEIDSEIDVLMLVHPKDLNIQTRYAIDQYLLRGGKAILFLDPLAEQDRMQADAASDIMPKLDSYLTDLLKSWGLAMTQEKIVGDINAAMRVQVNSPRGPQEIDYLPWLQLTENNFNRNDFSSSELNLVNMGTAGALEVAENQSLTVTPLIQTSRQSTLLERDLILFQPDPAVIWNNFKSEDKKIILAARIQGETQTAFPDGAPLSDTEKKKEADQTFVNKGNINLILVTDTDILADHFWIRSKNMFGVDVPQPIANNGDFVINSIENLSGNTDLISLRGRGKYSRPFNKVNDIRKEAEKQFRQQELELETKLEETENKIRQLQQEQGDGKPYLLDNKLKQEIDKFRNESLRTRKELRNVQHELRKNIEKLGSQLRFINIALIPLLITLAALIVGIYRANKRT